MQWFTNENPNPALEYYALSRLDSLSDNLIRESDFIWLGIICLEKLRGLFRSFRILTSGGIAPTELSCKISSLMPGINWWNYERNIRTDVGFELQE